MIGQSETESKNSFYKCLFVYDGDFGSCTSKISE